MNMKNEFDFGKKVRIIEPGRYFGMTGTIVRDSDPETLEDWYAENLPIRLDLTGETIECHEPWGEFGRVLEVIG